MSILKQSLFVRRSEGWTSRNLKVASIKIESRRGEVKRYATTSAPLRKYIQQLMKIDGDALFLIAGYGSRPCIFHAAMMYCQKCRTPLRLDDSLENLNPAAFDLLIGMRRNIYCTPMILTLQGLLASHYPEELPRSSTIPESEKQSTMKRPPSIIHPRTSERYLHLKMTEPKPKGISTRTCRSLRSHSLK